MTKRLLIFSFIAALTLMAPQTVKASDAEAPAHRTLRYVR